ncbi:MAG: hypothetical protein ITG02_14395 [Patulibacter sp.]|nr:hypothetical protein [Patulibacter sp.]
MRVRPTSSLHSDRPGAQRRRSAAAIAVLGAASLLVAPAAASAVGPGPASLAAPPVASALGPGSLAAPAAVANGPRTTKATVKKTSCASISRKAKKAKGKQRTQLRKQLKRCQAAGKAANRALKAIRDGRYVGERGDGQTVDWTLCASGKYALRTTSGRSTGVSEGSGWRIGWSEANGSSGFTVIVEDPKKGLSIGLALRGAQWSAGIASFGSVVNKLGDVERTDAKAACAAL